MSKLKKTSRKIFFLVLATVVLAALYGLVFVSVRQKSQHALKLEDSVEYDLKKAEILQTVNAIFLDTERERSTLDTYFVTDKSFIDFVKKIESLGRGAEVTLRILPDSVREEGAGEEDFKSVITFSLELQGRWADLETTLALLETLPYAVSTKRVQFDKVLGERVDKWRGTVVMNVLKLKT